MSRPLTPDELGRFDRSKVPAPKDDPAVAYVGPPDMDKMPAEPEEKRDPWADRPVLPVLSRGVSVSESFCPHCADDHDIFLRTSGDGAGSRCSLHQKPTRIREWFECGTCGAEWAHNRREVPCLECDPGMAKNVQDEYERRRQRNPEPSSGSTQET